jgi:hypothetical protein
MPSMGARGEPLARLKAMPACHKVNLILTGGILTPPHGDGVYQPGDLDALHQVRHDLFV